jgi:hypothetical protein
MIKQMAWNTFKKTGNIDSYLELVEIENVEKNIKEAEIASSIETAEENIKRNIN